MTEQTKKQSNLKLIIGAVVLVVLIAAFALIYVLFGAKTVEGSKHVSITVVNKAKEAVTYELDTDAEVLMEAMRDAESQGLTYSGTEGQYGIMVSTVNGELADYSVDGGYWSFYVNGDYCNYGIDTQPVADGDAFKIAYETSMVE